MDESDLLKVAWVVMAVILAAGEIVAPGMVLLPFAIGAGFAAIPAFMETSFVVQLLVFFLASAIAFVALRPFAKRMNEGTPDGIGSRRLINSIGTVIGPIDSIDGGMVRIDREEWRAETEDGSPVDLDTQVRIIDVKGTRVVVTTDTEVPSDPTGET
jgi:membrane protein implicated in regulation of membrane protease activity